MVIAILVILVGLLLPALSRTKAMAHKTVCFNNQKQIEIPRQLYATDNERHLVPGLMVGWGIDAVTGPSAGLPYCEQGVLQTTFPWTIPDSDVWSPSRMIEQGDASRFAGWGKFYKTFC